MNEAGMMKPDARFFELKKAFAYALKDDFILPS